MLDILGPQMIGYWHLIDQIMFNESILKTLPKNWFLHSWHTHHTQSILIQKESESWVAVEIEKGSAHIFGSRILAAFTLGHGHFVIAAIFEDFSFAAASGALHEVLPVIGHFQIGFFAAAGVEMVQCFLHFGHFGPVELDWGELLTIGIVCWCDFFSYFSD